jgi:hypothetical protein
MMKNHMLNPMLYCNKQAGIGTHCILRSAFYKRIPSSAILYNVRKTGVDTNLVYPLQLKISDDFEQKC